MRRIETDDAARWLEFIWLGPVNSPWPFEARGRAWVMALVLCPPLTVLAALAVAPAARIALDDRPVDTAIYVPRRGTVSRFTLNSQP